MLCILCSLICTPGQILADAPEKPAGLMWLRSDAPAVFPLIVKTPPGQDYVLTLHAVDTEAAVLAAYVRGGTPFRVLVPPGKFTVHFAAGHDWQGEAGLFGADTQVFDLVEPLAFKVTGYATKSGHLIDLTAEDGAPVTQTRALCQRQAITEVPRPLPPFDDAEGFATRLTEPGALLRHPDAVFDPQKRRGAEAPVIPADYAPYFSDPEFSRRTRLCD